MFTGIVEETGEVKRITQTSAEGYELIIGAQRIQEDMNIGDSISCDGVCLTVTRFDNKEVMFEVMPETVRRTTIKTLITTSHVNLERSMLPTTRVGGHFVTGHVDGVGKIMSKEQYENAIYYTIMLPDGLSRYFIPQGSVAIDGISLTVFKIKDNDLTISLIPHTVNATTIGFKNVDDLVNVECDMLAKHVENQLKYKGVDLGV